eukprot:scaffold2727_cov140-Isochrysis_galbana.AAC.6
MYSSTRACARLRTRTPRPVLCAPTDTKASPVCTHLRHTIPQGCRRRRARARSCGARWAGAARSACRPGRMLATAARRSSCVSGYNTGMPPLHGSGGPGPTPSPRIDAVRGKYNV